MGIISLILASVALQEMVAIVVTALAGLVSAAIIYAINQAVNWLKSKTNNERIQNFLMTTQDIIESAVISTQQQFVEEYKKTGTFTKEEAVKAFKRTKETVLREVTIEAQEALSPIIDDFDVWLTNEIEAKVNRLKQYR